MAVKTTTLFSLAKLKGWLQVEKADRDADLEAIADWATDIFERETRVLFVKRTVSEVYDGLGSNRLLLNHYPIQSVTTLTVKETQEGTAKTITSADYDLNLEEGVIRLRSTADPPTFPKLFQNVTVAYPAGYGGQDGTTLPGDIFAGALDLAKLKWDELQSGAISASSISIGPGSLLIKPDLPIHIRRTLDAWRRPMVA